MSKSRLGEMIKESNDAFKKNANQFAGMTPADIYQLGMGSGYALATELLREDFCINQPEIPDWLDEQEQQLNEEETK